MPAKVEAGFAAYVARGQFDRATELLKESLRQAVFVDPRDDYSWGPESDVLGYQILAAQGPKAFIAYWEDMLHFFTDELEPKWGHLHKGHVYFRLGLGQLALDKGKAVEYIEMALDEDRLVAATYAPTIHLEPEVLVHRFPSYVTLAILERCEATYFESEEMADRFFAGLAPLRFDVIWDRKEVELSAVRHAISVVVPPPAQAAATAVLEELAQVCQQQQTTSPLTLTAALAEMVLYAVLRYRHDVRAIRGADITYVGRGTLLGEVAKRGIFPTKSIWATFEMVDLLDKSLNRPTDRQYKYAVTPHIRYLIGYALKILFDRALVEWAERIA